MRSRKQRAYPLEKNKEISEARRFIFTWIAMVLARAQASNKSHHVEKKAHDAFHHSHAAAFNSTQSHVVQMQINVIMRKKFLPLWSAKLFQNDFLKQKGVLFT